MEDDKKKDRRWQKKDGRCQKKMEDNKKDGKLTKKVINNVFLIKIFYNQFNFFYIY